MIKVCKVLIMTNLNIFTQSSQIKQYKHLTVLCENILRSLREIIIL